MLLVVTLTALALGLLRGLLLWAGAAGGVIFLMLLVLTGLYVAILTGGKRWVIVLLLLLLFVLLILLPAMVSLSFPAVSGVERVGECRTR